jgi:hypothetical protein
MIKNKKNVAVLVLCFAIYIVVVGFLFFKANNLTDNHFVYTLDDPYIHLQMAQNLANNGSFGIIDNEFSSTSSSPFWTLLLAGSTSIFGDNYLSPFILNIFFGLLALIIAFRFLENKQHLLILASILLLIAFASPMHALTFAGMEHLAQIAGCFMFLIAIKKYLDNESSKNFYSLLAISFVITSIRFECSFLVFAFAAILFFKKKRMNSIILLIVAGLPILIYGIISLSNGWHFFPNSVLLKAHLTSAGGFSSMIRSVFFTLILQLGKSPHILILLLISAYFLNYMNKGKKIVLNTENSILLVFIFTSLLHMQLGSVGWFFRYEAYITALGILVNGYILLNRWSEFRNIYFQSTNFLKITISVLAFFILMPLIARSVDSTLTTTKAQKNILEQQFQMTRFIQNYYQQDTIAINDIGMVSYYTDAKIVDVWGLANNETGNAILGNYYNSEFFEKFLNEHNVKLVISYESLFGKPGVRPEDWLLVATWRVHDNYVLGDDLLGFYSKKEDIPELLDNLEKYSAILPKDILQKKFIQIGN